MRELRLFRFSRHFDWLSKFLDRLKHHEVMTNSIFFRFDFRLINFSENLKRKQADKFNAKISRKIPKIENFDFS